MPYPSNTLYPSTGLYPEEPPYGLGEDLIFDPDESPIRVTNMTDYVTEAFEYTPARPRTEWLESADSDGAIPTNEVHWTNAEGTLRVRVNEQINSNEARALISAIVDKGMKARRMVMEGERGLPVAWNPKDSDQVGTLYLIEADSWSVPMEPSGENFGYFRNMPVFSVHLTFAPGVEMPEVETAETTWATPVGSIEVSPQGELRTPARLILTDNATTARKTVQIGQERYNYASGDLWLDEAELTETTPSNSVVDADASGGNAIELLGLFPGWQDVATRTGDTRRGTFRVRARVKAIADEEEIRVRLKWRVGAGPYTINFLSGVVVAAFATAAYVEVDLGIVQIPAGAANLDLIVQAQSDSPTSAAEGVRVDALAPQPAERTATVQGDEVIAGGQTLSAYDGFGHGAVSDPLTGTAPEVGNAKTFTVTAVDDVFTSTAQGFVSGEAVILSGLTGAAGVTAGPTYYVRDVTANTFKLAATSGGAAINITSDGSGTVSHVWTGAGDAAALDDFTLSPLTGRGLATRNPAAADTDLNDGRYVTVGGALTATTLVGHFLLKHTGKTTAQETRGGFIVRNPMSAGNPDPLNWLGILVRIRRKASGNYKKTLRLYKRVAGTLTLLKEVDVDETTLYSSRGEVSGGIAISVDAAGVVSVAAGKSNTEEPTDQVAGLSTTDSVLATSGALASGEAGSYHAADFGNAKATMTVFDIAIYSSVSSMTNTYAIPSGGRLELDADEAISYSAATGGTAVPVKHRGAALWLEPEGDEAKQTRLAIRVSDNVPGEAEPVAALGRSTKGKLAYKPIFLLFPGT